MRFLVPLIGVLAVGCQQPELSTTTQELVALSPLSHDFGSLEVGSTSAPFAISVNPAANANDDFVTAVTASCPDFQIDAPGLPAEVYRTCDTGTCATPCFAPPLICVTLDYQNYAFNASFNPTVAGAVSCVVSVQLNNATVKTLTLTGTGTLPPIAIDVAPASLDFGQVRRDTDSGTLPLDVRDAGGAALTVSSVAISPGFAIVSGQTTGYQVQPGATETYQLACHPTATGALSGTFTITSDDPSRGTVTIPLSCTGIDSAMAITPSPAMIPTTRVGEPRSISIDIGNTGTASMMLQSVTLSGAGLSGGTMGGTAIAPGGSVPVTVAFDAATAGDVSGAMVATYDSGQTYTAQISARALATSMALTPDGDVDFGPVCAGQTKTQTFTILGNADGAFVVTDVSTPAAPFTVTAPSLPASVAGAGANQVMFSVTAAPADAGHMTSMLVVTTDIPGGTPRTINLAVDALTAGVTPTPSALDFGSNPIESTTIGQAVHVSNCSGAAVAWSNPRIEGVDASEFAIVAQPDQPTIPATGFASWLIVLQAHTLGPKAAAFSVDYAGGTATIPLAGEGLGAAPPVDPTPAAGESSYYSCQTGRAAGGWPIAIALALVWRRRSRGSRYPSTT